MKRLFAIITALLVLLTAGCSAEEPPQSQVVNPIHTVDSPDTFPGDLRFYMLTPENAEGLQYSIIFAEIAQIKFAFNGEEYTLRGSWEREHMSGVYGPFEETDSAIALDHPSGSCQISIRYTTEGVAVAEWSLSPMFFSLSSGQNTDRDTFSQLVTQVASCQLDANLALTQSNLQERFAEMACDSSVTITASGQTYTPYATVVYSTFWDGENMISADGGVQIEDLKKAGILPTIPYSSDFTVSYSNDGILNFIILHDENFQRLDDAWSFNVFSQLSPGTYYVQAIVVEHGDYIPEADQTERSGIDCAFELIVE